MLCRKGNDRSELWKLLRAVEAADSYELQAQLGSAFKELVNAASTNLFGLLLHIYG